LSLAEQGGHARLEVCDWDRDGRLDLVVADGGGTLTWFRNTNNGTPPKLAEGKPLVLSDGNPIRGASRASVVVADWDRDQLLDIVFADEKGYRWYRNSPDTGGLSGPLPISFGGPSVRYVRPNLGAFVDWDGDGKPDLIGCHFENSIRLYRNLGPNRPGTEPQFAGPEGQLLLTASSPQMISGADVIDWNGDGDLDILTGQGHGGSGLRFYERDWVEDERNGTHPIVTEIRLETRDGSQKRKVKN
jgi:hypothetical protein